MKLFGTLILKEIFDKQGIRTMTLLKNVIGQKFNWKPFKWLPVCVYLFLIWFLLSTHTIHYRDRLQKGQEVRLATLQVTTNGKRHRVTMDPVSNTKTIKKNMESRNIKHVNLIALWNRKTVKNEAFCNK